MKCPTPASRRASACVNARPAGDVSSTSLTGPRVLAYPLDRGKQRLRLHHHPRPAAERHVVDHFVPIVREVPQVMHNDVQ